MTMGSGFWLEEFDRTSECYVSFGCMHQTRESAESVIKSLYASEARYRTQLASTKVVAEYDGNGNLIPSQTPPTPFLERALSSEAH